MGAHWRICRVAIALLLFAATDAMSGSGPAPAAPIEGSQIGKVVNVRKVLRNPYFVSRYPTIHYYILYLALRISDQAYCAEYETPVLEEINDAFASKDTDVEVVIDKKHLTVITKHFKFKARMTEPKQC